MKTLEFFFDLSSPYSYLAATQVGSIADRTSAEVVWKPMVLGALFKAVGNEMPARVPHKARWMGNDLQRWADHYGVPWRWSSHFPTNAIKAMRLVLVDDSKAAAVALAGFSAMWAEDRDITAEPELRRIAEAGGLDPAAALAAIESPAVKDRPVRVRRIVVP